MLSGGGRGAIEVVARGAMEGKIVSNFSKRLEEQQRSNRVVAKMNTDFRFPWLLWFIFWVWWDQSQGSSFAEISTVAQIELGLLESLQSCRY